jgi:heme exporter protein C
LILFFLYLGYIALTSAIDDERRGDRAGAMIAIVGAHQCADHLFLGEVVEHLAPRRFCVFDQVAQHGASDVMGHVVDGLVLFGSTPLPWSLYRVRTTILRSASHILLWVASDSAGGTA